MAAERSRNPLLRLAGAVLAGVLRVLLLALGALAAMVAMLMGLLLAAALVVWALLRGRKPVIGQAFVWRGRRSQGPSAGVGEVVDAEVREVPDVHNAPGTLPKP